MNASDVQAGPVPPMVISSVSNGKRRFSLRATAGACHRASTTSAALGRGGRQLTPALLGIG